MLHTPSFPPPTFQRRLALRWESLQLNALRRFIAATREATRLINWLRPIQRWLWLPPTAFVVGLASGLFSRFSG
jgi:uncharacterized protein (DUF2236 family)